MGMHTADSRTSNTALARAAGWLIAVAGIVPAVVFTYFMTGADPQSDPKGFAQAATSVAGLGAGFLYILSLIALIFALFALYGWLSDGGRPPLAGLILGVLSAGLLLAAYGAFILASAVAADVYLAGHADAALVMQKLSGGSFGHAVMLDFEAAIALGVLGAILFGVAIWRSGKLPKWSGVVYAAGFALLALSMPVATQLGGVLLLIAGIWMARSASPSARAAKGAIRQAA